MLVHGRLVNGYTTCHQSLTDSMHAYTERNHKVVISHSIAHVHMDSEITSNLCNHISLDDETHKMADVHMT